MYLPKLFRAYLAGLKQEIIQIGCTDAKVIKVFDEKNTYYLKIERENDEAKRERELYAWLQGKVNVPSALLAKKYRKYQYLLLTKAEGVMCCDERLMQKPEFVVQMLAKGIKALQQIPIHDCPFDSTIQAKLEIAKKRIDQGLVSFEGSDDCENFASHQDLYDYLVTHQPKEELSFIHGDYCLPNIFVSESEEISFIDLGRGGVGDIYQDIALCIRSLRHNFKTNQYSDLLFKYLNIVPNFEKIRYYILLDELF